MHAFFTFTDRPNAVRRRTSLRSVVLLVLGLPGAIALPAAPISPVAAAVYRCPDDVGRILFQDRPCRISRTVKQDTQPSKEDIPGGMHPSWFMRPVAATGQASCSEQVCECNAQSYPLIADKLQMVGQALYIDGNWHRYERLMDGSAIKRPVDTEGVAPDPALQVVRLARAACEIMIAQVVLKRDTDEVLRALRNRLAVGRALGLDDDERCAEGDEAACAYRDDLQQYQTLQADIKALRLPRTD